MSPGSTPPHSIINAAAAAGGRTLTEHESKTVLAAYGIPVTNETLAESPDSAVSIATALGYPVVVKASGPDLAHKTESEAIAVDLRTPEEVREAAQRLLTIRGSQAVLVQELISGNRELVCGIVRDDVFGPSVMVGFGGIFTEVIDDAVFRLAPITTDDARAMIDQLNARRMLDEFRGQSPAERETLARTLVQLSNLALDHQAVREVDINPFIVRADGTWVAADALIVVGDPGSEPDSDVPAGGSVDGGLDGFFAPQSVAIIGASATTGKPGHEVIRNIQANSYPGALYLVNPKGGTILDIPVYRSIDSLPDVPDLAVVLLPADSSEQALSDCAAKGIRNVVLSAGGFSEVDEHGLETERALTDIIRHEGLRALGPNTAGHISTPGQFTSSFFPLGPIRPGTVSYVTQTGNFCTHTMKRILTSEHFGVARVFGLGNAVDIDEVDALEYLAADDQTQAIVMYIESFQRPRRFLEVARRVTRQKPVVLLKGGATEAGHRAAVAHTAAMAAPDRLIEGMLRQAGVVRLSDYTQLILCGRAFSMAPLPRGRRVSFLAPSGAMLVTLTDLCVRLGLEVPDLDTETVHRLQDISPPYIRMRNPVDIWPAASTRGVEFAYREAMKAVLQDPNVDAVVPVLMLTADTGVPSFDFILELAGQFPHKPIMVGFSGDQHYVDQCRSYLEPRGIATFAEIEEPLQMLSIMAACKAGMPADS